MPEKRFSSHLRVGDLDVQGRVLAIRRLSTRLFDQVRNRANLVEHPELGGSGRGCRVDEDPLALDHDLQRWEHELTFWGGEQSTSLVVPARVVSWLRL